MDMFVIHGGRPLCGQATVSGAKNAALPLMAAALAADGETILRGVPRLVDVETLSVLLETLGVRVRRGEQGDLSLCVVDPRPFVADYELVRRMRAGVCVLGPLLARRGRAVVSLPGGCNIGDRPIDLHLKGLRALGAEIEVDRGYVVARANRLRGARVNLGGPFGSTVTGTCNVMTVAAVTEGTTTIESAACEPEVVELGDLLNRMGAQIAGLGTSCVRIEGVRRLRAVDHSIIPDRIEAATLMIAAAITRGHVTLTNVRPEHMTAVIDVLRAIGVDVQAGERSVTVRAAGELRPADCVARAYPGVPTDVQAQLTALLATVEGTSVVTDNVFPDRFLHAAELARMGAQIRREGNRAVVRGVRRLGGASVMASDLRASAALVLAGLAADGLTVVRRIYHLDRGYERLETKLNGLGAEITRACDEPANVPAEALIPPAAAHPAAVVDPPQRIDAPHWFQRLRASRSANGATPDRRRD